MANKKSLYILTSKDIRKIRRLTKTLELALTDLIELRRITTLDDTREYYNVHESDLTEERSYLEYQLEFFDTKI